MDGHRFDIGVSNPFLKIFLEKFCQLNKWKIVFKWLPASPGIFGEIAVNGFHHFISFDGIKSVEGWFINYYKIVDGV